MKPCIYSADSLEELEKLTKGKVSRYRCYLPAIVFGSYLFIQDEIRRILKNYRLQVFGASSSANTYCPLPN